MQLTNISLADAGIVAILGYAVVFFGLILLMAAMAILGRFFISAEKKNAAGSAAPASAAAPAETPVAPGSAGGIKLHNVEPKTAALLMAIIADKLGKPLNELRFISIKEVEQ